jgi:O-antigen/teichoic acid export membrane protein
MAGYLVGCALALTGFRLALRAPGRRDSSTVRAQPKLVSTEVPRRLWAYALPLAAIPLIGWVSGQADRYLLGGMAGVAVAGIYAALYGLASKPFVVFSTALDATLRQPYYARVSAGDAAGERRALTLWFVVVGTGSIVLCLFFVLYHAKIAALVLAAEYRAHSALMGWIAAGYVLLGIAQVLERVCYAHHDTRGVVWVEAAGAALSVVIAAPLVWRYGIEGAAWAVPVYFGVQLLLAAKRARRAWRQGRQPFATPSAAATSTPL